MKNLLLGSALGLLLMACGGEKGTENTVDSTATVDTAATAEAVSYSVDAAASKVKWSGNTSGVKVYGHHGVIDVKEGSLELTGDAVTGGSIIIDMTTIQPLDSAYSPEGPKEKLVGHLSNGDFFLVDSFPTAQFVVKSFENGVITGDLTIRDKTNEEKVTDVVVTQSEDGVEATGKLVFDRQNYGVAWKHFLKDVLLSDEIPLEIKLVAKK